MKIDGLTKNEGRKAPIDADPCANENVDFLDQEPLPTNSGELPLAATYLPFLHKLLPGSDEHMDLADKDQVFVQMP